MARGEKHYITPVLYCSYNLNICIDANKSYLKSFFAGLMKFLSMSKYPHKNYTIFYVHNDTAGRTSINIHVTSNMLSRYREIYKENKP